MKENLLAFGDAQAGRVAYLVAGYIRKTLTEAEHDELDWWVEASDEHMLLFEELTDEQHLQGSLAWMDQLATGKGPAPGVRDLGFSKVSPVKKRTLWPLQAAAIFVVVVLGIYLLRLMQPAGPAPAAGVRPSSVPPGSKKATLTLGNGRVVDLAAIGTGPIEKSGATLIEKTGEGILRYQKLTGTGKPDFNILALSRGSDYALTLSDGTQVWLNALSSLRYPEQFSGVDRVVELSGEAFFQVAGDVRHPFVVRLSDSTQIGVVGTRFNVFAYREEAVKKVTLLEGKVLVRVPKGQMQLDPGEQLLIGNNQLFLKKEVDTTAITGWKSGRFVFQDADIYHILRQAERWYDVQVVYRTVCPEHFNFSLSRDEPLSKFLHLMELTGKVHFKMENKSVYVLP